MKVEGGNMFITTAGRTNEEMVGVAKEIAQHLQVKFVSRQKQSIEKLQEIEQDSCIVIGKDRFELFQLGEKEPFFFHPNSAMFRLKRLMDGGHDPFVEAAKLKKGMKVLDCTLGIGSDSIVASFVVGPAGAVVGVEANEYLAYLVRKGLKSWTTKSRQMNEAMSRIQVIHASHLSYLKQLSSESFDCVYFDPMFEEHLTKSAGISALSKLASYETFSDEVIHEALRVAKKRIILKDHFRSRRFEQFDFSVIRRKSAKFHFGIIEK